MCAAWLGEVVGAGEDRVIEPGSFAYLPMAHLYGADLLDYSTEGASVREPGVYQWAATVECAAPQQRGGFAIVIVGVRDVSNDAVMDLLIGDTPRVSAALPAWQLSAGEAVGVAVINRGQLPLPFRVNQGQLAKLDFGAA